MEQGEGQMGNAGDGYSYLATAENRLGEEWTKGFQSGAPNPGLGLALGGAT